MARICDRSPCDGLLGALGVFIFGVGADNKLCGFVVIAHVEGHAHEQEIDYCPFCGTRIEEVNALVVERFMKPRLRRRKTKYAVAS